MCWLIVGKRPLKSLRMHGYTIIQNNKQNTNNTYKEQQTKEQNLSHTHVRTTHACSLAFALIHNNDNNKN